jgi:hypothetical protein
MPVRQIAGQATTRWMRQCPTVPCECSRYGVCNEGLGDSQEDRRLLVTSKSDFTTEEWQLILEAPPSAGMIVVTAQRGGSFRETIAIAKAYVEARQQHGESELLDEIVATKPERDHTHYHSPEELKQHGLQHLRDAVVLLERKATPEEVDEYRRFIVTLSHKVAAAHREHGQDVSEAEQAAINDIAGALNTTAR